MIQVNVHEAKTRLSKLLAEVERGEEVVIARSGRPVARLVAVRSLSRPRKLGAYAGHVVIHDGFDELPEDIEAAFEGSGS